MKGCCLWLFTLALASAAPNAAAQPIEFEILSVEDGLSSFVVNAVRRDSRGYVWIGTQTGLNRHEGPRIRPMRPPTGGDGANITSLLPDPEVAGAVWVGTRGRGLLWYDPETSQLQAVADSSGQPVIPEFETAVSLAWAGDRLWVGTAYSGLWAFDPETGSVSSHRWDSLDPASIRSDSILVVHASQMSSEILWVGTADGLGTLDTGSGQFTRLEALGNMPGDLNGAPIQSIFERDGVLWFGTDAGEVFRFDLESRSMDRFSLGTSGSVWALHASRIRDGTIWVGTRGGGLLGIDSRTGSWSAVDASLTNGAPHELTDVLSIEEDSNGILWVGSVGGLYKSDLKRVRFSQAIQVPGGAPVLKLYQAPSRPEVTWAGTARGGLMKIMGTEVRPLFTEVGQPGNLVFAMREDSFGQFWFGTTRVALYGLNRSSLAVQEFPLDSDLNGIVKQIYEAPGRPGMLWVVTSGRGLIEFDAGRRMVTRRFNTTSVPVPFPSDKLWVVQQVVDRPEMMWIGTESAGLYLMNTSSGAVSQVPLDSGCASETIISLLDQGGILWAGTRSQGLIRYKPDTGECRRYTKADGLSENDVGALFLDGEGRVWMSSSNGITVLDPETEAFTRFYERDGLQANIFHYPASFQRPDGTILFGGPNGFNVFEPLHVPINSDPPHVAITQFRVDGEIHPLKMTSQGFDPITLRYDQHDLEVEFASLDLRSPDKNRYRVRLDGAETEWHELGNEASARFPFLEPDRYVFQVQASNGDGYWNTEPVNLPVWIKAPIWQRWYFILGVALVAVGLVVATYRYRARQKLRLERTRRQIADDLHDDIGSKVSTVALRLDLAGREGGLQPGTRKHLDELSGMARDVVSDLRDSVWIVDVGHDTVASLVERMEQFAHAILVGRRYSFDAPDTSLNYSLGMESRRHLYLLYKEALANAVRHAEAESISVAVSWSDGKLTVTIADDGKGFDLHSGTSPGRGLRTMKDRAEALGGTLEITSSPGAGTEVSLSVELAN